MQPHPPTNAGDYSDTATPATEPGDDPLWRAALVARQTGRAVALPNRDYRRLYRSASRRAGAWVEDKRGAVERVQLRSDGQLYEETSGRIVLSIAHIANMVGSNGTVHEVQEHNGNDVTGQQIAATASATNRQLIITSAEGKQLVSRVRCAACDRLDPKMKRCAGCGTVYYCGADCQLVHWRAGHRIECPRDREPKRRNQTSLTEQS